MRFLLFIPLLVLLALLLSGCAGIKESELNISVKDSAGNPLEGVEIKVLPYNENQSANFLSTDNEGLASVILEPGTYTVIATKADFSTGVKYGIKVLGKKTVNLVLQEILAE